MVRKTHGMMLRGLGRWRKSLHRQPAASISPLPLGSGFLGGVVPAPTNPPVSCLHGAWRRAMSPNQATHP